MTTRFESNPTYPNHLWDTEHKRWVRKPNGHNRATSVSFVSSLGRHFSENDWPEPKPLPDVLLPVVPFDPAFLPDANRPWVLDIAERMQCAPEFVAIPAIVALGSVIGCKVGVRPQRKTDWTEAANLWGCIVGRPRSVEITRHE
jgi:Protein of unknown function (DUF3987)